MLTLCSHATILSAYFYISIFVSTASTIEVTERAICLFSSLFSGKADVKGLLESASAVGGGGGGGGGAAAAPAAAAAAAPAAKEEKKKAPEPEEEEMSFDLFG